MILISPSSQVMCLLTFPHRAENMFDTVMEVQVPQESNTCAQEDIFAGCLRDMYFHDSLERVFHPMCLTQVSCRAESTQL